MKVGISEDDKAAVRNALSGANQEVQRTHATPQETLVRAVTELDVAVRNLQGIRDSVLQSDEKVTSDRAFDPSCLHDLITGAPGYVRSRASEIHEEVDTLRMLLLSETDEPSEQEDKSDAAKCQRLPFQQDAQTAVVTLGAAVNRLRDLSRELLGHSGDLQDPEERGSDISGTFIAALYQMPDEVDRYATEVNQVVGRLRSALFNGHGSLGTAANQCSMSGSTS